MYKYTILQTDFYLLIADPILKNKYLFLASQGDPMKNIADRS